MKKTTVVMIVMTMLIITGCGVNPTEESLDEASYDNGIVIDESSTIDYSEESMLVETVVNETLLSEESIFDEESFISQLSSAINLSIAPRDNINEVSIDNGVLYVSVSLERNNRTLDRFSSVSDAILSMEEGYIFWDSVLIDFGNLGYITKSQDDIVSGEDGNCFEIVQEDIMYSE